MSEELTASSLFALSQGQPNSGPYECHWCSSPCENWWTHDDVRAGIPFISPRTSAKRPANPYICSGCWLWRRKRITITYLDGTQKDGQCALKHSWFVTDKECLAIKKDDYSILWERLFKPPLQFFLAFTDENNPLNHLHLINLNNHQEVKGDSIIHYTLNNVPLSYNTYELEEALTTGTNGKEGSVGMLFRILGKPLYPIDIGIEEKTKGKGRPKDTTYNSPKKVITGKSG